MYKATALLLLLLGAVQSQSSFKKPMPPVFKAPADNVWSFGAIKDVRKDNNDKIDCWAEGFPKPTYQWTLEGYDVSQSPCKDYLEVLPNGTMLISKFYARDKCDGYYQCLATNKYGTSMTAYLYLRGTFSENFHGAKDEPANVVSVSENNYLKLPCEDKLTGKLPRSAPPNQVFWSRRGPGQRDPEDTDFERVSETQRIAIDNEGTIHFLWVEKSDHEWEYVCNIYNTNLKGNYQNTQTFELDVKPGSSAERGPAIRFQKSLTVMKDEDAILQCIFSYYSPLQDLKVTWSKGYGRPITKNDDVYEVEDSLIFNNPSGRLLKVKKAKIPDETQSVEGYYTCKASLRGHQDEERQVHLTVVAPPVFTKDGRLIPMKATVGSNTEFMCKTYSHRSWAKPVVWLHDGKPIVGCVRPNTFECAVRGADGYAKCLPPSSHCDQIRDCDDHSDEKNCPQPCAESTYMCKGRCIPQTQECEAPICSNPRFQCDDFSSCINDTKKCNKYPDCPDKSDEKACSYSPDVTYGRFTLNGDRSKLTLNNVSPDDNTCFQCFVENEYGTLFGSGCLQVIDKIEIGYGPEPTYLVNPGDNLNLGVDATTDPSMKDKINYEWHWVNKDGVDEKLPSAEYPDVFHVSLDGKNMTVMVPDIDENDPESYKKYNAIVNKEFYLIVGHDYETVRVNFTVNGVEAVPPATEPTIQAAGGDLWWLAIVVGVLFLIVVVIVIFCYLYRNRGGVYLLDKKEHKAGHDPEQELKDSGFHDVGRVGDDEEDQKPHPDEVSLTESVKPYDSDEDITEEYGGDIDFTKFNEEGSFIGVYGDKKSKNAKEATV